MQCGIKRRIIQLAPVRPRFLEGPGPQRGGRRTRDGRTPFVAQGKLAAWFQLPQPDISRIEKYWLEGDWPNLLSLKTAEVLTQELVGRIVTVAKGISQNCR